MKRNKLYALLILFLLLTMGCNPEERADFQEVIAKVKDGSLVPDSNGVLLLPPELENASVFGKAYIDKRTEVDGSLMIIFPTWRETPSRRLCGYLYCSNQPSNDNIINVWYKIKKKFGPNWYFIKTKDRD